MRGVVGADAVGDAAAKRFDQRLAVVLGAKRRVHLEPRVEAADLFVGEHQVMRRQLGRQLRAVRLGRGDRLDRNAGREVLDVGPRVLVEAEGAVAGDHRRLGDVWHPGEAERGRDRPLPHHPVAGQRRVLLVEEDRAPGEPLVLERPAHHPGVGDRQPVVGEAERAGLAQRRHLGQLAPLHAAGDGRDEAGRDDRLGLGPLAERRDDRGIVDDRVGVRHRDDPAVAARGGGPGPGLDVLAVLLAGRPQMDVRVEEGREGVEPAGVDLLAAVGKLAVARFGDRCDPPGADHDVAVAIELGAGIDRMDPADQQVLVAGGSGTAPVERCDLGALGAQAGSPIGAPSLASAPNGPAALSGRGRSPPARIS